jgi:hypothetical protein
MTTLCGITVAAAPLGVVVGLLWLADRLGRRRDAAHARQIELTDAIHREMGAAAAPTVERRRGGRWLVRMMVPLDNPAAVATILRITAQVFAASAAAALLQIVLTPRPASRAAAAGPSESARLRAMHSAASIVAPAR